jgi:hypothetical protein
MRPNGLAVGGPRALQGRELPLEVFKGMACVFACVWIGTDVPHTPTDADVCCVFAGVLEEALTCRAMYIYIYICIYICMYTYYIYIGGWSRHNDRACEGRNGVSKRVCMCAVMCMCVCVCPHATPTLQTHRPGNYIDLRSRKCQHPYGCGIRPSFGTTMHIKKNHK